MGGYDRRTFLTGVTALGATTLAGCSSDGDDGQAGDSEQDALSIVDNEIGNDGSATTSTVTVENGSDAEVTATLSVAVGIGTDGLYGTHTDEQTTTIAAGETADVVLALFDANELSEVAYHEIQNGYFTLTYFVDDAEKSHQEFGEKPSKHLSFRVRYDGSWQGSLGTEGGQRSISGRGESHLPVDNGASIVSGNAQKQDDSAGTLTVQILVDGDVVSEQSTTAEYGIAQVSENV